MQNEAIIHLTENAINHVRNILAKKPEAQAFRLSIKKVGCSGLAYVPEITSESKPDDVFFQQDNLPIYVAADCVKYVKGMTMDFVKSGLNQNWVYNNPNVKNSCGCGESFNVENEA